MAKGPQAQHNAITIVMRKAIALSKGLTAATPMSLLAASAGREEKILPTPKKAPIDTIAAAPIVLGSKVFDLLFFKRERALAYRRRIPKIISILIVVNDGFPPVVVVLPIAKKMIHITANVTKYVETYKIPFFALFSPALSTVMTVITDIGLTMDAMAKGTTTIRS